MMKAMPKATKKLVREWAEIAYDRELSAELQKLHDLFNKWADGGVNPFELTEAIHQFHKGPARQLHVRYGLSHGEDDWLVANAITHGIIKKEEVPAEVLESLTRQLAQCEEHHDHDCGHHHK